MDYQIGLFVRIVNSFPLETWAQGQDLNPDPESLWATGPKNWGAACLRFPGVGPLQAEAKNDGPNNEASQTKGIIAPNKGSIKEPNGGNKILTTSFMSLKATPAANQELPPGEGMGSRCKVTPPLALDRTIPPDVQRKQLKIQSNH
ncbi:hypothetical protein DSO57_1036191 [Entomophthora muscae]|uniref:Uncharacterized protein n=1 Tax=Entomophthora muscae TaxID=34485 RepID=A0ACC2SNM7_9FUNG|nr:hypothetical protein DSO57_1036191 [Entomophthora muscae]